MINYLILILFLFISPNTNEYKIKQKQTKQMITYTSTLDYTKKDTIRLILNKLDSIGVTNRYIKAAILAVVSKETGFSPISEISYKNTANDRIRKVFGQRVQSLTDAQLDTLKSNDEAFFNRVYGGLYGNKENEGYKYRGRGLNGITFKGNYIAMQKYTKTEIVENPDNLNKIDVAVDVLVGYFVDNFAKAGQGIRQYNMTSIHDAKTLNDAVGAAYHANAGWGLSMTSILNDSTGGRKKAFDRANEMLIIVDFLKTK